VKKESLIIVERAALEYRIPSNTSSLKELAVRAARRSVEVRHLTALTDVSFTVDRGEVLGIIGPNGAGKSTLMKLLARVLPPSEGRVRVRGRVSPMIELGAGFNGEQTARENVILYGTLLGRDSRYMRERCQAIAEWAEVEDYLDVAVRAFSSGMVARLAFSVAVDVDPDVLLVDEILAVGDDAFRLKSGERMTRLISAGTAVVLVSHNMPQVLERAHRVLWLDHGRVVMFGDPEKVVAAYQESVSSPVTDHAPGSTPEAKSGGI
jgi:ABC-2 type transport system ATP-binding protein/lipopolysaccharide transport system ATP-binding protein